MENEEINISNCIREIKQEFFAFRNGVIADRLRSAGDPHAIVFGLNLPQVVEISSRFPQNSQLAQTLWENVTVRESRMLAPMLFPKDEFTEDLAKQWIESIENQEIADVLCHRLLRYTAFAESLCRSFADNERALVRYLALRLAMNLLVLRKPVDRHFLSEFATGEIGSNNAVTKQLAQSIIDEINEG